MRVSRAQKISTVVDSRSMVNGSYVSRAQKISTVVDNSPASVTAPVSRAQKISTVVDADLKRMREQFHALKKFLLL